LPKQALLTSSTHRDESKTTYSGVRSILSHENSFELEG
jgi:hypothetical protein